jgi:hypothetical protein
VALSQQQLEQLFTAASSRSQYHVICAQAMAALNALPAQVVAAAWI